MTTPALLLPYTAEGALPDRAQGFELPLRRQDTLLITTDAPESRALRQPAGDSE